MTWSETSAFLALTVSLLTLLVTQRAQAKGKLREFKADAYRLYLSGIAIRNDADADEARKARAIDQVLQAKYLVALYGSRKVVDAMENFEWGGRTANKPEDWRKQIRGVQHAMREDLQVRARISDTTLSRLIFNVDEG